jgi:hypothetical protein
MGETTNACRILVGNAEGRSLLGRTGVDGRIILI